MSKLKHPRVVGTAPQRSAATASCAPSPGDPSTLLEATIAIFDVPEQSAAEQLRLLRSVLDHATDAVLITEAEPTDLPGPRILYANAAFTRMTGYTPEELLGQTPRLLQGPRSDRQALDRVRAALTAWAPVEVELINYRKDGTEFWVELSISPVADETGWYTHWIAIQRDITARKRSMEQRERDRAAVLELSARGAPLAEVLSHLRDTARQLLDDQPVTIEGPGDTGDAAPDDAAEVWRHPILGDAGRLLGRLVVAARRPVTADDRAQLADLAQLAALLIERDRSRLALHDAMRREEILTALGDVLQQAMTPEEVAAWAMGQLGPALSSQCMLVVRLNGEQLQQSILWGDVPPAVLASMSRPGLTLADAPALRAVAQGGQALYVESYHVVAGALTDLPALGYGAEPLCTPDGTLQGFLVAWRAPGRWDAGERTLMRRAAATVGLALERAEGLAQIGAQRVQLLQSNAELRAANEELQALTYSASHDLMTPVRHVKSFAELARKALAATPNEKATTLLTRVETAAERMSGMIDALLRLARSGQQPLRRDEVQLSAVVDRIRQDLEPEATGRAVAWQVGFLPAVLGDEDTLQHALSCLMANALKFTRPREHARIEIWGEERAEEWAVFVRDNGVGFDPQYTSRLFGAFQRLHTEQEFEGIGIGLATVRRTVLRHGGSVSAQGTLGHGATFGFTLPRTR
ncbi:PAS domain-containing protein [uncultured Deinococcus sp.]|uniref:PAS domain-containing sensor histidine kinase n=1 Tax=uncultured Deinococcus sp. TaxID=158789 RepID=UPI0025EBDD01|nr:PAS domain-containing protein [uncultured Deinococcus sp.]